MFSGKKLFGLYSFIRNGTKGETYFLRRKPKTNKD